MKRFVTTILCGISIMSTRPPIFADAFDFYARGPYRPSVPRPSQLLGYEPGEYHTDFRGMERVIFAIAQAAADRVRVIEYGQSYERRPLRLLLISAPENVNRLEELRARIQKLADPRRLGSSEEAATIIRTTPVVVWLNYANDGNESAAFEAALQVAYHLAASEEPKTRELLEKAIILINPAHNPESHERFVAWYNAFAVGAEDRFAYEHNAPWGFSTNNNHYQIDLNRDALASTQIETQALMRAYLQWNPQVFVDHHGQTATFFFPPPAAPVNANLPKAYHDWMEVFGRGNAEAFDRQGWAYFARDVFDLFYPGYWDSWPSLNGAIGMTYETDGGGSRGLRWLREDGALVTLRDGIAKHFVASLATVETAIRHRERLLQYFYDFKRTAIEEGARGPMRWFVLLPGSDPGRAAELAATLLRAGIEVQVAQESFSLRAAHDYLSKTAATRSFPAGALIVDLAQPQMRLAKALLEPEAELDPQFVKRQLEIRERNERRGRNVPKERYEFYDVTAWSLPLAFGVEAYWTEDAPRVRSVPLALDESGRVVTSDDRKPIVSGGVTGRAISAYVFSYETNAAARLAFALLNEGYKIAVSTRPLRADGRDFPRGTLLALIERNPESLHERIAALAREYGVNVYAAASAYTDRGDTGIGSPAVTPLRKPKIIVITGEGVSVTSFGAIWFLFERRFGIPFVPMTLASLQRANIFEYDVILFPDGNPSVYRATLGDQGLERLKRWVNEGGVLIGIGGAAELFTQKGVGLTTAKVLGAEEAPDSPGSSASSPTSAQASAEKPTRPLPVPGAILRATVDRHHFLTFGYEAEHLPVLVNGARFLTRSRDGANVVTFEGKELHVSGFVWPNNTVELLSGTAYLIHEPTGRGHVILYAQDPNFRLFWHSLTRLFLNSLLFAPSLR